MEKFDLLLIYLLIFTILGIETFKYNSFFHLEKVKKRQIFLQIFRKFFAKIAKGKVPNFEKYPIILIERNIKW